MAGCGEVRTGGAGPVSMVGNGSGRLGRARRPEQFGMARHGLERRSARTGPSTGYGAGWYGMSRGSDGVGTSAWDAPVGAGLGRIVGLAWHGVGRRLGWAGCDAIRTVARAGTGWLGSASRAGVVWCGVSVRAGWEGRGMSLGLAGPGSARHTDRREAARRGWSLGLGRNGLVGDGQSLGSARCGKACHLPPSEKPISSMATRSNFPYPWLRSAPIARF